MVTPVTDQTLVRLRDEARRVASTVVDPEIPVISIADLGILREVVINGDRVEVVITPTYSGCPAMNMIKSELEQALAAAQLSPVVVTTVLSPAWTTDWITETGRQQLLDYGIAPPARGAGRAALFETAVVACPRCSSTDTSQLAAFGSTACKALWRCNQCREPFDYFKCH